VVLREAHMRSPTVMKYETMRLGRVLGVLEHGLRDGRDYLLASGFSAVDTNIGYSAIGAARYVQLAAFPKVLAYTQRLQARPSFQKTLTPEGGEKLYHQDFYPLPDA